MTIYDRYSTRTSDYPKPFENYNFVEFTVASGVVDYDVNAETDLFNKIKTSNDTFIWVYDNNIEAKLSSITNAAILMDADTYMNFPTINITNVYITASGGDARVRMMICGWR